MAWNGVRHMETWYGIMGLGGVVHTLNPRLSDKDLQYIMNHAADELLLADITFLPQLQRLLPLVPSCKGLVFLTDRLHMPQQHGITCCPVYCYEELLSKAAEAAARRPQGSPLFSWKQVEETAACGLCYTSGTTGNPKGVLYSHRAQVLHALLLLQGDAVAPDLGQRVPLSGKWGA
ncbi:hypothetical protein V8C86DRAFT_3105752 [Haematococcus lacustris]